MSDLAPTVATFEIPVAAVAAGSDLETVECIAPFDGTVTAVSYITVTAITGADTNTRKVEVYNRGQAGAGTQQVALLQFNAGVSTVAEDEKAITLVSVNVNVTAGDVLAFKSTHVGTGTADPGGLAKISITRS